MNPVRPTVPSPCVNVCQMDAATGLCAGCLRTLDEIACWSLLDEAEKAAVWAELDQRRLQRPAPSGPGVMPRGAPPARGAA